MEIPNSADSINVIGVLNQLLTVQSVLHIFPSFEKIADFSAQALKNVPGVQYCSFCLSGNEKPIGDSFRVSENLSLSLSKVDGYRKDIPVQLPSEENLILYSLQTIKYSFGYVLILVENPVLFERFRSAVSNLINIIAIYIENSLQNKQIQENQEQLVALVQERTAELEKEIAAHKRAEEALKASEVKQKAMIANISDVITIIDKEGIVSYESPNIEKFFGWRPEEIVGKPGFEFVHPEDRDHIMKIFSGILPENGAVAFAECRYRCKDGSFKWVRNSAINLLHDPVINGVLINYHDISERKKSEETLHTFQLGIERSPEAIFMTDPEGIITYCNPAFTEIYGYPQKEAIGQTPRILKSGQVPEDTYSKFWETLVSKEIVAGEIINKRKDGTLVNIEGVNNPILNEAGKIIGFLAIHRDISMRKRDEEALRISEERFRKAFMISPDSININRVEDGMFMNINEGFTRLTGFTSEDVIGRTSAEISIWADLADRAKLVEGLKLQGEVINLEAKFRKKNGMVVTALMSASVIDFNGVPHILSITREIEAIRKAQNDLKESEERFKQVAENAGEWIWEVDVSGLYTYSSPIVENILGYTTGEIVGVMHFYDLFSPDKREALKTEAFAVFRKKGFFQKYLNENVRKDGKIVILETSGAPILDKNENLLGYRGTDSDITIRVRAEEALRESEERWRTIVENEPECVKVLDPKGRLLEMNPAGLSMLQAKLADVQGKKAVELVAKEDQTAFNEMVEAVFKGETRHLVFDMIGLKGRRLTLETTSVPLKDMGESGEVRALLGVTRDITIRKQAEEELRKLSRAVEQSPASIVITNTLGEIEYVNPRFTEVTGYTFDEARGTNPRILKSGYTSVESYAELWTRISSGKEWRGEFRNRKKNGDLYWETASISPIINDHGIITHYLAVKEDITEKKEADRRLLNAIIDVEERERLRFSRELHDGLGPIMSTVKLYFQWLAENTDPDKKINIIAKGNYSIDEAIQSLREISNNLSPRILTNHGFVPAVVNFIHRLNETEKIIIDFKYNIDQRFDKNLEITLFRITTELINNTIKYAQSSQASITFNFSKETHALSLRYRDDGMGFDLKAVLQSKKGLGLLNIQQRVKTLNGLITIETGPGLGVDVYVEFPLNPESQFQY